MSDNICIHHTDAERKKHIGCPICLRRELTTARCALGAIYGIGERTVTEGIELLLSDFRAEKNYTTRLILDKLALTGERDALKSEMEHYVEQGLIIKASAEGL